MAFCTFFIPCLIGFISLTIVSFSTFCVMMMMMMMMIVARWPKMAVVFTISSLFILFVLACFCRYKLNFDSQ